MAQRLAAIPTQKQCSNRTDHLAELTVADRRQDSKCTLKGTAVMVIAQILLASYLNGSRHGHNHVSEFHFWAYI